MKQQKMNLLIMKKVLLSFLIVITAWSNLFSQSMYPESILINRSFNQVSLEEICQIIEENYPVHFFYDESDSLITSITFSGDINNQELDKSLEEILYETPYTFSYIPPSNYILIPKRLSKTNVFEQESYSKEIRIGDIRDRGKFRNAKLEGVIVDGKTNTTLVGAVIYAKELSKGAVSDFNGNYSIELPAGKHTIQYSSVGFEMVEKEIEVISSGELNINLFESSVEINEVVVSTKRPDQNVSKAQMSTIEITSKELSSIPTLMGEVDLIKSMTLMPGVQTVGEAATGFNIRGGNIDQNLILVDDVPIFNTSHLFGFFSTIHPDAVSNVTLYKGNIPATYGGRVSSVMDIEVKDKSPDKPTVSAGIGLINARLTVEMPLANNRVSVVFGARSTYSDWILKALPDANLQQSSAGYYDLIGKVKWRINQNNSISVFGYKSYDRFNMANTSKYNYGNLLGNVKVNHLFSSRLSASISAGISEYELEVESERYIEDPSAIEISSGIRLYNSKLNIKYTPLSKHTFDIGFEFNKTILSPGIQSPLNTASLIEPKELEREQGDEYAFYISDNYDISHRVSLNVGLRYSMYQYIGPKSVYNYATESAMSPETVIDTSLYGNGEVISQYQYPEPRVALRLTVEDNSSIKIGYNFNAQYIQLLSNTAAATPTDIWKLADYHIQPITSNQFSIGYFRNFFDNTIETSIEGYYKQTSNLIDYKNGAVIVMNENIEADLLPAEGKAYGIEFLLRKGSGDITGWLGYTYSRSFKKTNSEFEEEQINNGDYYPSAYDKPHDITTSLNYKFSRRWSMSGNFTYSTGRPTTLPEYQFEINNRKMVYFSDRNNYRLPDYHRLDLSITYHGHIRAEQRWVSSWTLSIYNVYGRANPYSVYYTKDQPTSANGYREYSLYKLSIVDQPIPTITYNIKF